MTKVRYSSTFDCSQEELFEFHSDVRALGQLGPPGQRFTLFSEPKRTEMADVQEFEIGSGPIGFRWVAEVTMFDPPRLLEDTQLSGPFRRWRHQHQIFAEGDGARLTDVIAFRFFPTPLGGLLEWLTLKPLLTGMFWYRHRKTRTLLRESLEDPANVSG